MNSLTLFMLVYNINKNKYCFHYNVGLVSLNLPDVSFESGLYTIIIFHLPLP